MDESTPTESVTNTPKNLLTPENFENVVQGKKI